MSNETERSSQKTREGVVVKAAMDKTVTIAVTNLVKHSAYRKYIRRSKKFLAHDEDGMCAVGDTVKVISTRPLSKRKCWRVLEVVSKATV